MNIEPTIPWSQTTATTLTNDYGHITDTDELYASKELYRYMICSDPPRPDIRLGDSSGRSASLLTDKQLHMFLIDPKIAALYMSGSVNESKTTGTTTAPMRPLTHIDYCGIPTTIEAVEFSLGNGLEHAMTKAIELARKHFRISGIPSFYLEQDPEDGDQFIVLEIQVESHQSDALCMYKEYARDWTRDMHLPDMTMVRLIYNID